MNVIGILVVEFVFTRWLVRCWLPDVPEVEDPDWERLPDTAPEEELELEVEPELDVLS